jgi:hypothetical protein
MNLPHLIRQLEEIETEWNGYAAGEKLSGNVVKEATYLGTATGIRIAINVLTGHDRQNLNHTIVSNKS